MGILENANAIPTAAGAADFYTYQIANSCRTHDDTSSSIRRTPSSDGNRQTWCISMWVKRAKVSETQFIFEAGTSGDSGSRLFWSFVAGDGIEVSSGVTNYGTSTAIFRDPAAWYHIFIKNASGTNTVYINGTSVKSSSISGDTAVNSQVAHSIACRASGTGEEAESYVSEFLLFDGTAYDPTDLAENKNGVWIPKDPSGLTLSGTNTTWLKFTNASDLGEDFSGNNNDWTLGSAITSHDQMLDSPTFDGSSNGGNFCTLNPIGMQGGGADSYTYSEGNLVGEDAFLTFVGTHGVKGGKWYFEFVMTSGDSGTIVGFTNNLFNTDSALCYDDPTSPSGADCFGSYMEGPGASTVSTVVYGVGDGSNRTLSSIGGSKWTTDDIIGVAADFDNGKIWFSKNGVWDFAYASSDPATDTSPMIAASGAMGTYTIDTSETWLPASGNWSGSSRTHRFNFGSDDTFAGSDTGTGGPYADDTGYGRFYYDVPAGFLAICSGNLPVADAVDPAQTDDDYPQKLFTPTLYTGNGTSIDVSTGFQTDLAWLKWRGGTYNNTIGDSSRGTGKYLQADTSATETSDVQSFTAFGSDGFTYGSELSGNQNTYSMISWNWRANGGSTSTNTEGDIDTTVQVDPSSSFSIVKYTASGSSNTFGHGLGAVPDFIIQKNYSDTWNWRVYHKDLTSGYYLQLNGTNAQFSATEITALSTTTVTLAGGGNFNYQADDLNIMYCFANCEGYSSFGSYEGNGDADGVFVYCGFRPALVTTKRTDDVSSWLVHDNKRDTYNPVIEILLWNDTSAEFNGSNDRVDFLSNGFKVRSSNSGINGDGNDYVYIAFAKNPFKYATAR